MSAHLTTFLLSALPPIPDLGGEPPISGPALLALVDATTAAPLVRAVLLGEDVLLVQAAAAGAVAEGTVGSVLDAAQIAGEGSLPEELQVDESESGPVPEDRLWAAWFRHVLAVAGACRSTFLARWAGFEIGLRNELTRLRAESLDVDADAALVLPGSASEDPADLTLIEDAETAVRHAVDPLAAQEALDRIRLRWLDEQDPTYSFDDDELAVYAVRLGLAHRWYAIANRRDMVEA